MDIAKVERVYTSYSGVYDHIFGKIFHESREACVRNLRIRPEENILEVGVGTGIALEYYPKNCNITGIDLSSGMLAKARQRQSHYHLDHVRLMLMDAGKMEFPDDSFDTVVCTYTLCSIPDPAAAPISCTSTPSRRAGWTTMSMATSTMSSTTAGSIPP